MKRALFRLAILSILVGSVFDVLNADSGWVQQPSGTTALLSGISCADAYTCVAVGGGAILKTYDGGNTWSARQTSNGVWAISCTADSDICTALGLDDSGFYNAVLRGNYPSFSVSALPTNPRTRFSGVSCINVNTCVVVGTTYHGNNVVTSAVLWTRDGGLTWSEQSPGPATVLNDVSCTDANMCVVAGYNVLEVRAYILQTTDGGASWTTRYTDFNNGSVDHISCAGTTCIAVQGYRILVSNDRGANWTPSGTASSANAVSCTAANTCYAPVIGYRNTILSTTDGGATWTEQFAPIPTRLFAISCTDPLTCYAVGENGLILNTTTGGQ